MKFKIFIIICFILCVSCKYESKEKLPILNPSDFRIELVDSKLRDVSENHTVSDFSLVNQNGEEITQEDYEDKIYVVDFFFTQCKTICPIMTDNMVKIQNTFVDNEAIKMLSLSVTPEIDSVPVLRTYADKKGVIDGKWNITTGSKKHIYKLARESYFATLDKGDGGLQDFIHTTHFVLVDHKKRIRGVYDGTDNKSVDKLIKDIEILVH